MEDKIQTYRQPLVTATGIILGFILNFATSFVKSETEMSFLTAYLIGFCVLIGIVSLITVLSRILNMNYPKNNSEKYYITTFRIFIFGICISFVGVLIDMSTNFMIE